MRTRYTFRRKKAKYLARVRRRGSAKSPKAILRQARSRSGFRNL